MKSGSNGSRLSLHHVNMKVHKAFLAYPSSCTKFLCRLYSCLVNSMRSEKGSALNEINIAVAGFVCQKVKVSNAKVRQEDACRHHGLHCDKYMTSKSVTLQFINVSRTNLKEKKP